MHRARDVCRVKTCLWMMVLCIGGCIIQIVRGKKAAARGESLTNMNIEMRRQCNENAKKQDTVVK